MSNVINFNSKKSFHNIIDEAYLCEPMNATGVFINGEFYLKKESLEKCERPSMAITDRFQVLQGGK